MQYFQSVVVRHWFDCTAQIGKLRQKVALHLPQTAARVSDILLVGGENQIFVLHHVAGFFYTLANSAVALDTPLVKAVIATMEQYILPE